MIIHDILKDSKYGLTLFNDDELNWLEDRIFSKEIKTGKRFYVKCIIRSKDIVLTPEEIVRQLYTYRLINVYKYPVKRIRFEHPVHFGRQVKKADIVVFDKDRPTVEFILVETKKPNFLDGKKQLNSYCNATGCPIGVWINGGQTSQYQRLDPNYFEEITDIPKADETIADVINQRFTLLDLMINDKLIEDNRDLKGVIKEMEDDVLANAGVDVFEEVFKLIFTKLYDEYKSRDDKKYIMRELKKLLNDEQRSNHEIVKETLLTFDSSDFRRMEFRNTGQTGSELREKIQGLFDEAKEKWGGIFLKGSQIELSPSHLGICVSGLQDIKLFNSNLQIIDEAFEYLVNKSSKGEKGQYFTPRHVIDMCVKMLNPKAGEYMIDPASGSCGFPVHTIFHITGKLFTNDDITEEEKRNVLKIFGIDFDEKAVREITLVNNTLVPVNVTVQSFLSSAGGTIQFVDVGVAEKDWANLNKADSKEFIALGMEIQSAMEWNTGYNENTYYAADGVPSLFGILNYNAMGSLSLVAEHGLAFDQAYTAMHSLIFMFNLV